MGQFVKIGTKADFEGLHSGRAVEVAGRTIAVFHVNGKFYAIDNECTHVGGPLAEGFLSGEIVTCPWHAAQFDLRTGQALDGPASENVRCYAVRVSGDDVELEMP
ncbi:MAG: non-heme iron oxygenase ferredoxin subunit [Bryobacterales bacterium]|nr:non-heme iron oxygenase ferredoxin subunit [Bryobacteraceae bacterium]MDW8354389.1 non-heme iron oxygenase ferredoxin subunit [Bryobacterales bacterium]